MNKLDYLYHIKSKNDLLIYLNNHNYKYNNLDYLNDNLKIIYNGCNGIIVLSDNKIFKITLDKNSYFLSKILLNKKYKHLNNVINIDVIKNINTPLYIIELEKCLKITREIEDVFDYAKRSMNFYFRDKTHNDNVIDFNYVKNSIKSRCDTGFLSHNASNIVLKQLPEIKKELIDATLTKYPLDIHGENIMYNSNGVDLVLIDILNPLI